MNRRAFADLKIESRKRALEIFRGALPPQHSARKDDCLSAKREFRLCSEARRCRAGKYPARGGIAIFKGLEGYTLIEILIAVLILGIVLSTIYASYTGTFRIIGETRHDAEVYGMARSTLDRMARDLQSAALWRGAFTFKTKAYTLGNREFVRVIFRSMAHIAFSDKEIPDGISVIEYSVIEGKEEGKEGYTLLRMDSLYRDPEKESSPTDGFLLCNRLESLIYTFYDESGKEHESWDSGTTAVETQKNRVPAAVLIRLNLVNETDRKRPHRFMIRVRLPFNRPEAP